MYVASSEKRECQVEARRDDPTAIGSILECRRKRKHAFIVGYHLTMPVLPNIHSTLHHPPEVQGRSFSCTQTPSKPPHLRKIHTQLLVPDVAMLPTSRAKRVPPICHRIATGGSVSISKASSAIRLLSVCAFVTPLAFLSNVYPAFCHHSSRRY